MELRQLRYFVEVAEREHVSEAAEYLHIAQSAISRQISRLEEELGVSLFERVGRNIQLTPIGKNFLTHAKTAIKAIDFAKEQIDEYLNPEYGSIKIGFPASLASHLLPTVISAFREEQPNIGFHLRQGSYAALREEVKNRNIALAFLGPVPVNDPDIEGHILFTEKVSALLPINHPLAERKTLLLRDLRNEDFVLLPKGFILRKLALDACEQAGFTPKIVSEGEDMDSIKGLVSAGIGVSLLPDSTFHESVPRLTVRIPIASPDVKRTVGIITPKKYDLAPTEKVFYDFVMEFFSVLEQYQ
ncbi:LysR family transcriptional regulator [Bacillus massiliglaciei]|uniref:LysR family transcriptional regulator n=1 Tax=Bacillus massiliglaciei TaxID=1816693 RepID=UPI000ABDB5C0|nr:LysR family transcriptional regulator [Bacillus massiliglaciei]